MDLTTLSFHRRGFDSIGPTADLLKPAPSDDAIELAVIFPLRNDDRLIMHSEQIGIFPKREIS
jgi:hypothetical protein